MKIRLVGPFWPKSGLFRQKEDQFRSIFSKRSAIRPRSDKADLLGSTANELCCLVCIAYESCLTVDLQMFKVSNYLVKCGNQILTSWTLLSLGEVFFHWMSVFFHCPFSLPGVGLQLTPHFSSLERKLSSHISLY